MPDSGFAFICPSDASIQIKQDTTRDNPLEQENQFSTNRHSPLLVAKLLVEAMLTSVATLQNRRLAVSRRRTPT